MTVILTPAASEQFRRYADTPAPTQRRRGHKFGAKRCEVHQGRHASLKECRAFMDLQLLERAGEIRNLREQVAIELAPSVVLFGRKKPALRIVIDFVYERKPGVSMARPRILGVLDGKVIKTVDLPPWQTVYADAKGMETPSWRIKAHLLALKVGPSGGVVERI